MLTKKLSLAKKPLQLKLDKEEAKKTGRFIALFVLLYLIISLSVNMLFPVKQQQRFIAETVALYFNGNVSFEENPVVSLPSGTRIEISGLCTGTMELFILVAAILASIGINLKARIFGALLAALGVFALNIVRIFATITIILATHDTLIIEFAHNVLFRVFLFVSIVAIYIAWFYWAVQKQAV